MVHVQQSKTFCFTFFCLIFLKGQSEHRLLPLLHVCRCRGRHFTRG